MDPVVILDTNVLLARCLDPSMDAKADLAREVFEVLSEEKVLPCITEAIRREFDNKLEARVGQIIEAVRGLAQAPGLPKAVDESSWEALEAAFALLRRTAVESAAALQILESKVARDLREFGAGEVLPITELCARVAMEAQGICLRSSGGSTGWESKFSKLRAVLTWSGSGTWFRALTWR